MAPRFTIAASAVQARFGLSRHISPAHVAWSLGAIHKARLISSSYLQKVAEGEARWAERAGKIRNGEIPHVWDILEERGYIKDVAGNPDKIKEIMRTKRIGAYVGVDPTADSMHVGHLLPMMPLFWLWFHGHPACLLLGGSTARIGDPSGRLESREIIGNATISKNITKLHYQMSKLWHNVNAMRIKYEYPDDWAAKHSLLNNSMWLGGLTMYDFIKRVGRHTRIGPMLARDTVKRKLTEGDGMSLGEFIYPMMQGWDFWHLYNKLGIQMQIGGSDQFGNIVAGIEALKTIRETEELPEFRMPTEWQHDPIGLTVPLLTDASGVKFGKTAGNAVWLDEFKTTAFDLYGYFMRRPDEEVEKLLKLFTFMPLPRIQEIMQEHNEDRSKRAAQHYLAFEVVSMVHGADKALQEAQQHKFRFGGNVPDVVKEPNPESGIINANNAPRSDIELPRAVMELSPAKILYAAGLVSSAAEGQRLVTQQGAYVAAQPGQKRGLVPGNLSWTPMKLWFPHETAKFVIDDSILILRKGKHNIRIVELVDDESWKNSGRVYPGQPHTGVLRRMKDKLRQEAEEEGREITTAEINRELRNMALGESIKVENNEDIELPARAGIRQQKSNDRWMMRKNQRKS